MISLLPSGRWRGRRAFLQTSALGLAGLAGPLHRARAAESADRPRAKHCIFIFLCGGPSQPDLWDLKPDAPDGIRTIFQPIATNVPGITFSELIPQVAQHADKLALIRSLTHDDNSHEQGIARTLLGQLPDPRSEVHAARTDHPGLGAILHRVQGDCGELPPWVILPRPFTTGGPIYKGQTAGLLGPAYDPVLLDKEKRGSLSEREVRLDSARLPDGVDDARLAARRELLQVTNRSAGSPSALAGAWEEHYEQAFGLLSSGAAGQAFDVSREPQALRERYGLNEYGQSFLLARRLVEAGVRVVNVFWTFFDEQGCQFNLWDNHGVANDVCGIDGQITGTQQITHEYCCPSFDRSFSALLEDLAQRGLLDETLVAVAGEFGRTPRINQWAGRDHWAPCYTQLLAGGGVRGGQVYGASDATGAYVKDMPVTPDDYLATVLYACGIEPHTQLHDALGRPLPVTRGTPLRTLF